MKQVWALIQARYSATRLPGKVLLPLGLGTVLEFVVERVRRAAPLSGVAVLTSVEPADDAIAELCTRRNIPFFRGSEADPLDRYLHGARHFRAEHICRITADCPLIDPAIIDLVVSAYVQGEFDYVACNRPVGQETFPDGMDTEVFSLSALERAHREATKRSEREHVTPYFWQHPDRFRTHFVRSAVNRSHIRLTLDERVDYELISKIVAQCDDLTVDGIERFLRALPPEEIANAHLKPNEGYSKTLREDR